MDPVLLRGMHQWEQRASVVPCGEVAEVPVDEFEGIAQFFVIRGAAGLGDEPPVVPTVN